jgi:DNA sulfur modification protein DndE
MSLDTIRISKKGREQLIRLKRHTGIEHLNILCRWAFCISLAEDSVPPISTVRTEQGMDIQWRTFSGKNDEIYLGLLKHRCQKDGLNLSDENLSEYLGLHIHRGLGYLVANKNLRSIESLFSYLPNFG